MLTHSGLRLIASSSYTTLSINREWKCPGKRNAPEPPNKYHEVKMDIQEADPQGYDQFRKFTKNMLLLAMKEPAPLVNEEGEETCQNACHEGQTPEEILDRGICSIDEIVMRPHGEDSPCDNPVLDVFLGLMGMVCQSGESILYQLSKENHSDATSQYS